jgi:MFS family permease
MLKKYPGHYWRLCLGALFFFLSFNMILPELPQKLSEMGGSQYLGWIISAFALGALVSRPFSGWVTDTYGRRWTILGGAGLSAIACFLYPAASPILLFFVLRSFHGFFTGLSPTGFTAYTTDIIPADRRGEALGWQGMFANIGASIGFGLGSWIVKSIGRDNLFIVAGVIGVIAFFVFLTLAETKPKNSPIHKFKVADIFYFKAWRPSLLMLLVCIPLGGILLLIPGYSLTIGFENKGIFLTVYITASLFVRIFSGKLSDRIGRPFSTAIGFAFQTIAMIILLSNISKPAFLVAAIFYGVGQGFNAPALFAWVGDESNVHTRGRALSMLFISLELGIFIGGLGSGRLFLNHHPGQNNLFLFWAFISVFGFLFSLRFIQQHKKRGHLPLSDISEI